MGRALTLICGLIFAVALGGAQEPPNKQPQRGKGDQENSSSSPAQVRPYRPYPERYSDACYQAQDHDAADLCAQWRAALAAEKAVKEARSANIAAIIGAILSLATVIGLIVTIWQTHGALAEARRGNRLNLMFERRSRRESRKAGEDQERALAIAAAHVEVARVSADRQLRAYVHVERGEIRWGDQRAANPQISLWVKNTGQTPARWFGVSSQIVTTNDLHGVDEAPFDAYTFDSSRFLQWPALGAQGDSLSIPGNRHSDAAVLVRAFEKNLAIQIFGVLLYETIDGELMESEFWFVSRPPHRFNQRLKDGARPNNSGLATFGQHEEVPRKMARASRVLKVYQPSERQIPNGEPSSETEDY